MAVSEVSEGPALSLIGKRLRALRKKYNRILLTEEAVAQGKPINKEQEDVLRSKPVVSALIQELEKLRNPLSTAVQEELNAALQHHRQVSASAVEDLLNLLYVGSMFDVKSQSDFASMCFTKTHERACFITYDYVTDNATDLLAEEDLDSISKLGGLLISRPADSTLSHRNALQQCLEHAKAWLAKSDKPIESNANVTYLELRERLDKIMASDYLTTTPVHHVEAAGAGSFVPFQVPIMGASVPVSVEAKSSLVQEQQKNEETTVTLGEHGSGSSQSSVSIQENPKDELETENPAQNVSVQELDVEVDDNEIEADAEEQWHTQARRGNRNQRDRGHFHGSGGRSGNQNQRGRGHLNGRGGRSGGRGYQNGWSQPHHAKYQPRSYQNNRASEGGEHYHQRGSAVEGGPNASFD